MKEKTTVYFSTITLKLVNFAQRFVGASKKIVVRIEGLVSVTAISPYCIRVYIFETKERR